MIDREYKAEGNFPEPQPDIVQRFREEARLTDEDTIKAQQNWIIEYGKETGQLLAFPLKGELRDVVLTDAQLNKALSTKLDDRYVLAIVDEKGKLPKLMQKEDVKPFLKGKYPHCYQGNDKAWCRMREADLMALLDKPDIELLLVAQTETVPKAGYKRVVEILGGKG